MLDHYHTVAGTIEHRIKVERSEFLGIASSVDSDAAFSEALRGAEKRFFDATHVCWAYRIMNGTEVRAHGSDAGEPSGSAGKPILSAIEKAGLVQTTVLIVRYFGGVKLGTGCRGPIVSVPARFSIWRKRKSDTFTSASKSRLTLPLAARYTDFSPRQTSS